MKTKTEEDKKVIVKTFLNNNLQITPQALNEIFNKEVDIYKLIEFSKRRNLIIVDENTLKEFLSNGSSSSIEVKIVYLEEANSFSIEDVLEMLKKRFEVLSKIIQENNMLNNVISLSKLKKIKNDNQLVVIGMVKDKTTYSITLEDFTAYETIQLDANIVNRLFYDDVIAIKVKKEEEEKTIGDKVFFPSLSFFRKMPKLDEEVTVYDNVIKVRDKELKIEGDMVRAYINDFKLFIVNSNVIEKYKNRNEKDIDVLISLIERRHLNPSFLISKKMYKVDLFLIDEIPDALVVVGAKDPLFKVYKGINIFLLPSGRKAFLKQRKIE
jgi:DNA polymerase II small subunit/DNA polymerase delta subunit B